MSTSALVNVKTYSLIDYLLNKVRIKHEYLTPLLQPRYQALVSGSEPLQSYLHKRLAENLNSEAALGTVSDVAQCVQWLRSTFLCIRAAREPRRYLGIQADASPNLINKKIEGKLSLRLLLCKVHYHKVIVFLGHEFIIKKNLRN